MDAHLALLVVEEQFVLLLGKLLRAAAGTDDHAEAAEFVEGEAAGSSPESASASLAAAMAKWKHARNVAALFLVHPGQFVEADDFACDLHVQFAGIEARDAADAAAAFEDGLA